MGTHITILELIFVSLGSLLTFALMKATVDTIIDKENEQ